MALATCCLNRDVFQEVASFHFIFTISYTDIYTLIIKLIIDKQAFHIYRKSECIHIIFILMFFFIKSDRPLCTELEILSLLYM